MQPMPTTLHERYQQEPYRDNGSAYSLSTVQDVPSPTPRTALLASSSTEYAYGTSQPSQPSSRRILINATLKMAVIFVLSTAFLGATLWLALPRLDECVPLLRVSMDFGYLPFDITTSASTDRTSRYQNHSLSCRP